MKKNTVIYLAATLMAVSLAYSTAASGETGATGAEADAETSHNESEQQGETAVNKEIQALIQTYQRSLNEGNVDLVRSVYADDAIFIGQPFPTATGVDNIAALYADFFGKLNFNVEFDVLEVELGDTLGFVRTRSHGTIAPKGQTPTGSEGNREVFVVKKINGAWKFYRYIFNAEI